MAKVSYRGGSQENHRANRLNSPRIWQLMQVLTFISLVIALSALPFSQTLAVTLVSATKALTGNDSLKERSFTWQGVTRRIHVFGPMRPRAVVLFLHGCNQSAQELIQGARLAEAAEKWGFLAVVPEQDRSLHPERCWTWYLPLHQARGWGEPEFLTQLTIQVRSEFQIPSAPVYVAGLSSGAAMANILASCYSDHFSGLAMNAGVSYRAAYDVPTAYWSLQNGSVITPEIAGTLAYHCSGMSRASVPTLLLHGTQDQRLAPIHLEEAAHQLAVVQDWRDDGWLNQSFPLESPRVHIEQPSGKYSYKIEEFDHMGKTLIKKITVQGMGHSWSGGDSRFPHTDPRGPDFTEMLADFFWGKSDRFPPETP